MKPFTKKIDGLDRPLYMLRDVKTLELLKQFVPSNTMAEPKVDEDSGVEYVPIMIEDKPVFDPNYQRVASAGPVFNDKTFAYEITAVLTDLPQDTVLQNALNAKRREIQKLAPPVDFLEILSTVLAAIVRKQDLSAVQSSVDALLAHADAMTEFLANLDGINAQIKAGGRPDVQAGYADAAVAIAVDDISPKPISR